MNKRPSLAEILEDHGYQDAEEAIRESISGRSLPMDGRRIKFHLRCKLTPLLHETPYLAGRYTRLFTTYVEAWIATDETGHWRMLATIPGSGVTVCLQTGRRRR